MTHNPTTPQPHNEEEDEEDEEDEKRKLNVRNNESRQYSTVQYSTVVKVSGTLLRVKTATTGDAMESSHWLRMCMYVCMYGWMYVCIVAFIYVRYGTVHQSCGLVIRVMLRVQYQRAQKG